MKFVSPDGHYVYFLCERPDGAMEGFRLGGSQMCGVFSISLVSSAADLDRVWLSPWSYPMPLQPVAIPSDVLVLLVRLCQQHPELSALLTGEWNSGSVTAQKITGSRPIRQRVRRRRDTGSYPVPVPLTRTA